MKITIIGAGNMGGAIARALLLVHIHLPLKSHARRVRLALWRNSARSST